MDINKIFSLFDGNEFNSIQEKAQATDILLGDFKEHPAYWLGMFKKLILNHKIFKRKIVHFMEKSDPELNLGELDVAGDELAFERAWYYIQKFNINEEYHRESINLVIDETLVKIMDEAIFFFQERELYERCAHIKKISDEIKKLL